MMLPYLQRAGLIADPAPAEDSAQLARIIAASGDRLKVAGDILAYADFFFANELAYDPQAVEKTLHKAGAMALLAKFKDRLATVEPFDVRPLEAALQAFVADGRREDRRIDPSAASRGDREERRAGAVRLPGHSRPAAMHSPHRAGFEMNMNRTRTESAEMRSAPENGHFHAVA